MVEFLRKYESRVDKIPELTHFTLPNQSIYFNFVYGVGVRCDVDILQPTVRAQSIYREVYDFI